MAESANSPLASVAARPSRSSTATVPGCTTRTHDAAIAISRIAANVRGIMRAITPRSCFLSPERPTLCANSIRKPDSQIDPSIGVGIRVCVHGVVE